MTREIKNKNNGKVVIAISLLGILLIGLLISFFLFVVLPNFEKTEVTIYKEVCRNETGTYDGYKCEDGTMYLGLYDDYLEIVTLEGVRCFKNNETWIDESCEIVEVDEIKISIKSGNTCEVLERVNNFIEIGKIVYGKDTIEGECYNDGLNCSYKIVREKKDLTIDWLEEHCELKSPRCFSGKDEIPCEVYEREKCKTKDINGVYDKCDELDFENNKKYECGDYIVGVVE